MPAIDPARMRKIRRGSRELHLLFIVLFVFIVLGALTRLTHPNPLGTKVVLAGIVFQGATLTDKIHVLRIVQIVLGAAVGLSIFYNLIRLPGLYSQGRLFTSQNVAYIRGLGPSVLCIPLVWLVGLIGPAMEVAAAQNQWQHILPSFQCAHRRSCHSLRRLDHERGTRVARGTRSCRIA